MRINRRFLIWGYCLLLSFAFLLICTKSSPLYPFNDWVDSNAFFTMGKGMMNGRVLYRDLFEQKGPYLYLVHGLAYLISNKTFLGVYIFEALSFSVFLFYTHKLISIYLDGRYSAVLLPLISALILNLPNFSHGDSAEEFCLPLLAFSLYQLANYFRNVYPMPASRKLAAANGIAAGIVLWTKFSLLGFWFGWAVSLFLCMSAGRHYLKAVKSSFYFLAGMLAATLPWILYFGLNNSIGWWLDTYININVTSYPNTAPPQGTPGYVFQQFISNVSLNPVFCIMFSAGLLAFVLTGRFIKSWLNRLCLLLCAVLLAFGVYGGGRGYIYYFLILTPFVTFGFISLAELVSRKFSSRLSPKSSAAAAALSLALLLPMTLMYNQNAYFMKVKKADLAQYKFAAYISSTEGATLLNYGNLDFGMYTTTGIVPSVRFFEAQNIDYERFPLVTDEQNRYVKEKLTDFIVIRQKASESPYRIAVPYLFENYSLVMEATQVFDGKEYRFLLFQRK